ncbi:MAG: bifunctional UDP-N-acetylmuramoyl-tripeptide:D-alanyl-D-alanine ligase/alanine racemase [Flavobacteriales bacterium]|nr:bifunctional UDP-N-acetylmuramoyl-tripeptide:D-alanyl-D-alanine ligase/alanine racemase [Flavobacteriales bacterium]
MTSFSYTIQQLANFCNAQFKGVSPDELIHQVIIDSRKAKHFSHHLFVAIKGPHHDGHQFIEELYKKGFRNFLISNADFKTSDFPQANFLLTNDGLEAFQNIARNHRSQFQIPIIGITGSNGKTIVKEWLSICLQNQYKICKNPKSYNSQVGVSISVLGLNSGDEIGVFEAGISQKGEMEKLQNIIQPSIGIFTNIGQAHSENFNSLEEKIKEKLKLFSGVEKLIYCKDHKEIHDAISPEDSTELIAWSKQDDTAFLYVKHINQRADKSILTLIHKATEKSFTIPFNDEASIENCLHLICTLISLNIRDKEIQNSLNLLQPLAMRLELKEAKGNSLLINDAYSSDIDSLKIALDFLHQQSGNAKKVAILSDLDETGIPKAELFPKLMNLLDSYDVEQVIGIGANFSDYQAMFSNCTCYKSTDEFIENTADFDLSNSAILLKGARRFQFERIAEILEQKIHETVLEVNLNAISENFHYYKSLLKKETKVMVMVKAFSYGTGSYEIAHHLEYHNADYLAVAYVDEGFALRKKGIQTPIMVLNPDGTQFKQLIEHHLEPEIYSFRQLKALQHELKRLNLSDYPIHLKVDTGMRRLGFESAEIDGLISWISQHKEIRLASVFSHLASSENIEDKNFTAIQIDEFTSICNEIESKIKTPFLKHILNSSGITNYTEAQFDMVRLGIGLYGIGDENLQNCSSLKSMISQIKEVPAGESVGYNRAYYADETIRIAIIPIGYADGLNRALSNGKGQVHINGKKASIIGNICMDMCMVDISLIEAQEGDEVIVWNTQKHILDLAKSLNTIPYEVLTNVSQRVKRVFLQE